MDAKAVIPASFNTQLQSPFFTTPSELRDAIYDHLIPPRAHIILRNQRLQFSACVRRNGEDWPLHTGPDPIVKGKCRTAADHLLWERLRSPWGSHFRCEEVANGSEDSQQEFEGETMVWMNPTRVCRRMLTEFVGRMADVIVLHVNDLNTLGIVLPRDSEPEQPKNKTSTLLEHLVGHLKALDISMRLDLSAYVNIEQESDYPSKNPDLSDLVQRFGKRDVPTSAWTALPLALKYMPALRHLDIWLDHTHPMSWCIVNERAFLTPLFTMTLRTNPDLAISINLPKPNPRYQSPDRHLLWDSLEVLGTGQKSGSGRIRIIRRDRQRQSPVNWLDGTARINWRSDLSI
ncbi:uncharacterized protein BDR25DRAFT_341858 [Lindgomyces ingoldianus]|uniref:Uncharacterized protein n=1 Tax=Lindgomyces ingoldianus TaxID=673940 RepID=A0ACB6QZJ9_9PLEO|nr:uncharacterized protein BDR25DRAFT_341858 [Lindgomyces ingoldianus]KAF2472458.1 hypothetical protein BDR25DRAFT_341858 [Lindgomyces ingoldianus]